MSAYSYDYYSMQTGFGNFSAAITAVQPLSKVSRLQLRQRKNKQKTWIPWQFRQIKLFFSSYLFFFFFAQLLVHILLITGVHDKSITICSWFPSIDKCGVLFEVESTHVISKSQEPHIFVWITRSFLHVCLISKRKKKYQKFEIFKIKWSTV